MATHAAASCSRADFLTAYGLCSPGDTLRVPAGVLDWDDQVVITFGINIIMAGIGQTVITSNYTAPDATREWYTSTYLFVYQPSNPAANEPFRLSGFTLDMAGKCRSVYVVNESLIPINQVRIDHIRYLNPPPQTVSPFTHSHIAVGGTVYGVMDNCEGPQGLGTYVAGYDPDDGAWAHLTYDHGTADNFYIEDCVGEMRGMVMVVGGQSGRYAVRHNTITIAYPYSGACQFLDAHGNMGGSDPLHHYDNGHSTMGVEVSNNIVIWGGYPAHTSGGNTLFDQRGGKAVVYGNRWQNFLANSVIKTRDDYYDDGCPVTGNIYGQNAISGQPQYPSDTYIWDNKRSGNSTDDLVHLTYTMDYNLHLPPLPPYRLVPMEDKEFWLQKTPFTGAAGMGVGPLSSRPATCTLEGAGWWDNVNNKLYRWTNAGGGAWVLHYTPYPYPHPLRGETSEYGETITLTPSGVNLSHAATSPTLYVPVTYTMTMDGSEFHDFETDRLTLTPVEVTPWDIRLGLLGNEYILPLLNWPSGSSPEMPVGTTAYVDKAELADGSARYNFRSVSPRSWTFNWERVTKADAALIAALVEYNEPLHFQNKWVDALWHWVIITDFNYTPLVTTFATGTPFYKMTLSLEEIL